MRSKTGRAGIRVLVALTGLACLSSGAAAEAACDLTAQFTAPDSPTAKSNAVGVSVVFKNQGDAACNKNRVSINAFNGAKASGYARTVGGSGGGKNLPALAPGAEASLDYTDNVSGVAPNSKVTYKVKYSSPHNDTNNGNHLPIHTVTYQ